MKESTVEQLLDGPSFETPAYRGLLRMRTFLRGEIADPRGEEACNAVSNHEAQDGFNQRSVICDGLPQADKRPTRLFAAAELG